MQLTKLIFPKTHLFVFLNAHLFVLWIMKESYASKNDHIFYYTVKSPGAALRVVARDGYGNVFEQTEITTPLEADYPDAY